MADLTDNQPVSDASNSGATLGPVQRDCICLMRTPDGPHIAQCNARFRAKFFGAWRAERFCSTDPAPRSAQSGHVERLTVLQALPG